MSTIDLGTLEAKQKQHGTAAAVDELIVSLKAAKDYDRMFDALLLKRRVEMGLPTVQPTSLDVPEPYRKDLEESYVAAAKEVGRLFLEDGQLAASWPYLRTINESQPLRDALDALPLPEEMSDESEALMELCLNQGAHPARGLEIMLHTHGTCNTITAYDQARQSNLLTEDDQRRVAAKLVNDVYDDLVQTVRGEVERKMALAPPGDSLSKLIAGREWLFADNNYHIDVSHLNSVVRYARVFNSDTPELARVLQLCDYGLGLAAQFQYPGEPPFDDFYPAHKHYYGALAGENVDEHLAWFRERLDAEPDAEDKPYLAFELVQLQKKVGRLSDAVDVARDHLANINEANGFSFPQLCVAAERLDDWLTSARKTGDPVNFVAALAQSERAKSSQ